MLSLQGKVAPIIGLGQTGTEGWGIGAVCAVLFARPGTAIFGGNRSIALTAKTQQTIRDEGGVCDVVAIDATRFPLPGGYEELEKVRDAQVPMGKMEDT